MAMAELVNSPQEMRLERQTMQNNFFVYAEQCRAAAGMSAGNQSSYASDRLPHPESGLQGSGSFRG
jgi:hypothetical protein